MINRKTLLLLIMMVFTLFGCVPKNQTELHFKHAQDFMELQMMHEAVIELKNGLRTMEKDKQYEKRPEKKLLDGLTCFLSGDNEKAKDILSNAIKESPGYWGYYFGLASIYISEMKYDQAIPLLSKIPEEDFGYGQLNLVLGMKAIQDKDYKLAIKELEEARAKFSRKSLDFGQESGSQQFIKNGAILILSNLLAVAYEKENKLTEAYENLQMIKAINPNFVGLKNSLSILEYKMMVKANPGDFVAWNALGWNYYHKGLVDDAIPAYKKALELNPSYALAWNNLGLAYLKNGDDDAAEPCFVKAVILNNDKIAARYANYNLARICRLNGKYAKALEYLSETLKIDPDYADAKKEYVVAFNLAEIEKFPMKTEMYIALGNAYFENGEIDNAISAYQKYLKSGENEKNYYNLGQAYYLKSDFRQAEKCYRNALRLNKKYWQATFALGKALKREGEFSEAIECLKAALKESPREVLPEIIDELAYAYFEKGEIAAAVERWRNLIEISNDVEKVNRREKILGVLTS